MSFNDISVIDPVHIYGSLKLYYFKFRDINVVMFGDRHSSKIPDHVTRFIDKYNKVKNGYDHLTVNVFVDKYLKPNNFEICLEAPPLLLSGSVPKNGHLDSRLEAVSMGIVLGYNFGKNVDRQRDGDSISSMYYKYFDDHCLHSIDYRRRFYLDPINKTIDTCDSTPCTSTSDEINEYIIENYSIMSLHYFHGLPYDELVKKLVNIPENDNGYRSNLARYRDFCDENGICHVYRKLMEVNSEDRSKIYDFITSFISSSDSSYIKDGNIRQTMFNSLLLDVMLICHILTSRKSIVSWTGSSHTLNVYNFFNEYMSDHTQLIEKSSSYNKESIPCYKLKELMN